MLAESLNKENQVLSEKLKRAEALKSNFLSNIRNEINNPLSSILGLSQTLTNPGNLKPEQLSNIAQLIYREAFQLEFQMRNIFAAADIEAGEVTPRLTPVEPLPLICEILDAFRFRLEEKNIDWSVEHHDAEVVIITDQYMLYIIIMNLIANALEYTPTGFSINISTKIVNHEFVFTCQDGGPGIETSDINRIFERFTQIEEGSVKSHSGHGIGLAVSAAFAEMIAGRLEVDSVVGKGSTFTLKLPLNQDQTNSTQQDDWDNILFTHDTIL